MMRILLQYLCGKRVRKQSCIGENKIPKRICFQQDAHRKDGTYEMPRDFHLCFSTLNVTDSQKLESKVQILLFIWNS